MKKIAIFIAIFLFLRPLLPLGEYLLNYDYIAKELCINKDVPEMHCNGKCHLMKELAKKASEENPTSEKKVANVQYEFIAILEIPLAISFTPSFNYNISPANTYKNLYSETYYPVFFRPPSIA